MTGRVDAGVVAAEAVLTVERLAREAGDGTVGTVGQLMLEPGLRNVIPGRTTVALDIRSVDDDSLTSVFESTVARTRTAADARGATVEVVELQRQPPVPMDVDLVDGLVTVADRLRVPTMRMPSGAAHDTMLVAERIPSAMIFVPCKDGISHSPAEEARPRDAAVAVRIALEAILDQLNTAAGLNTH